jgi:hypothetical protein
MAARPCFSPAEKWGREPSHIGDRSLHLRTRECACGSTITADVEDPGPEVLRHNETYYHRLWWLRYGRPR